jgi:hypothetical protein
VQRRGDWAIARFTFRGNYSSSAAAAIHVFQRSARCSHSAPTLAIGPAHDIDARRDVAVRYSATGA